MIKSDRSPLLLAAVVSIVVAAVSPLPLKNDLQRDDSPYRLNEDVIPSHYKINISPDFEENTPESFNGSVVITAVVTKNETSQITLHKAENIVTTAVEIFEVDSDINIWKSHSVEDSEEFLIIQIEELNEDTEIFIKIDYEATFPDGLYGFYISKYTVTSNDEVETEDVLLTTQFQPTYARKAFPCFDEPGFKATFEITLNVPEGYNALSNMEQKETSNSTTIEFSTTPPMSTYLVAFIIYKIESFGGTSSAPGNLPFRTWGRLSAINAGTGDLSQDVGPNIIKEMEDYTGIQYTANAVHHKIDQAAIPDFSFGAMENWGLVTYRETALLYDKAEHTQLAKRRVTEIIAHELSHQWFGNLVTTQWWDSMWLNEGFATLFEYYLTDKLQPEWRMQERMVLDEQLAAFGVDATNVASPLTTEVNTPEEVMSNMGTITYSKGGSVLRMFNNILGDEKFKSAVQRYLEENALGSVTPTNLFDSLTRDANVETPEDVSLAEIFESWTNVSGFPVIHVTRTDSNIKITQEQFLLDGTTTKQKYNVYINLTSNDGSYTAKNHWLLETENEVIIEDVPETGKWLLVESSGYFRVNYDYENWALLTEQLQSEDLDNGGISPLERAMLLDNALNLARANKLNYSTAIQLLSYLENEVDYIPWAVGFSGLNFFHRMLAGEGDVFNNFVLNIIDKVYDELEFKIVDNTDDTTHIEHVHRANVLNWACRVGHQNCTIQATEHLRNYLDADGSSTKVAPELRSTVYCYGVKNDNILWTKLWSELGKTDDATERSLIISALGCSEVASTLYLYLESSLSGKYVRSQDTASVFSSVYSNPGGVDVALDFLHFNIRKIERSTATLMNSLSNIIRGIAQNLKTEKQKKMLGDIAAQLTNPVYQAVANGSIETVDANMLWLAMHKSRVLSEMEAENARTPIPETTTPGGAWTTRSAALLLAAAAAALALLR